MTELTQGTFPAMMKDPFADDADPALLGRRARGPAGRAPLHRRAAPSSCRRSRSASTARDQAFEWVELPGTGTIYTFTVVRHPLPRSWPSVVPYVSGVIELDGTQGAGARLLLNITDADPETVRHRRQGADLVRPGQRDLPPAPGPDGLRRRWDRPRQMPAARAGRPRRFEAEDELRILLDAALVVMERNGYSDAAVADILARGQPVDALVLPALRVQGPAAVRALPPRGGGRRGAAQRQGRRRGRPALGARRVDRRDPQLRPPPRQGSPGQRPRLARRR